MKIGHNLKRVNILLKKLLKNQKILKRLKLKYKNNQIKQYYKKMLIKCGMNLILISATKIEKSLR